MTCFPMRYRKSVLFWDSEPYRAILIQASTIHVVSIFQLDSEPGAEVATTVLPSAPVAPVDHMFLIEEVPARPTEVQPAVTEVQQLLTEVQQPVTEAQPQEAEVAGPAVEALPSVAEVADERLVLSQTEVLLPTEAAVAGALPFPSEEVLPAVTEAQLLVENPVPVTEAQVAVVVTDGQLVVTEGQVVLTEGQASVTEGQVAAAVTEGSDAPEAVAALRDVPTPSVDFGLIQEVTGVQRDEPVSS